MSCAYRYVGYIFVVHRGREENDNASGACATVLEEANAE